MIVDRLSDDCASCHSVIYVLPNGIPFSETFCAVCRIANALEEMLDILERREE